MALRAKYAGKRLRTNAVKIFSDGVLETRTAAVLEPYVGFPDDLGKPNLEPEAFGPLATALDKEGFQIHVHAIGDRAIRMSLDALEAARTANGPRDARHHLAHIELIDPADIPRFRGSDVIANFQPLWANGDKYLTELTEPKLGPARSRWLYPIGSVVASGAPFAFGSDWSVSSMNPLEGIEVAVTRRQPSEGPGAAWLPEERIPLPDAIAAYTIRGAYLDFSEKETGSIEVGKAADLVVLDRNLFEIPPSQIHEAKVLLTLLEGKEVYRAPGSERGPARRCAPRDDGSVSKRAYAVIPSSTRHSCCPTLHFFRVYTKLLDWDFPSFFAVQVCWKWSGSWNVTTRRCMISPDESETLVASTKAKSSIPGSPAERRRRRG